MNIIICKLQYFSTFVFIDFCIAFVKFEIFFSLKTSLLKWRPDFDSAADEYNKAGELSVPTHNTFIDFFLSFQAMCFRNAKCLNECKDCLMKCADCHKQNRSLFHAAKALDQAVLVCKDLSDFGAIKTLAEKACNLYQQHGSPESGAASLDKAAKILDSNYPRDALDLFTHALEVSMVRRLN